MGLEDGAVEEGFLGGGRVVGVHVAGVGHLLVRHLSRCVRLQPVDPAVPHPVAELLLLPVQNVLRGGGVMTMIRVPESKSLIRIGYRVLF